MSPPKLIRSLFGNVDGKLRAIDATTVGKDDVSQESNDLQTLQTVMLRHEKGTYSSAPVLCT